MTRHRVLGDARLHPGLIQLQAHLGGCKRGGCVGGLQWRGGREREVEGREIEGGGLTPSRSDSAPGMIQLQAHLGGGGGRAETERDAWEGGIR